MDERELKAALEAIIFASGEPVPAGRISLVLGVPEAEVYSLSLIHISEPTRPY